MDRPFRFPLPTPLSAAAPPCLWPPPATIGARARRLPSAVPARPPSGAPRGCQVGPAVSRPRPRVRLTRGTHGADRRQPRAPGPPWTERLTRGPHSRGPGPRALSLG
uniref:Uncharacterized protein n=1 Tax=Oryza sativa subsp. japonica TaxID=39947 RepID=Q6EPB1_ORYSJ|nr:hypothetical protein [Oryza sativa Japonica Group]